MTSMLKNLKPQAGSRSPRHRVGRGSGSGWGETSGRGSKGQKARAGCKLKPGFEGGQTPFLRRIPKFGFTNAMFKVSYQVVNLDQLAKLSDENITPEVLQNEGIVSLGPNSNPIKILGRGAIDKGIKVAVHKCSKSARKAIESKGGQITLIEPKVRASIQANVREKTKRAKKSKAETQSTAINSTAKATSASKGETVKKAKTKSVDKSKTDKIKTDKNKS